MKFRHLLGAVALAVSLSATAAFAQATGTAAEAKAMLDIAMAKLPTASLRQRNRAKTFEQAHHPQRCDRYRWRGQRCL